MLNCLIAGAGGFIGTIFRYSLSLIPITEKAVFPYITLFINVLGAFLIGLIMGFSGKLNCLSPSMILFLKVGICGGFTTFSTFALETADLYTQGNVVHAILYMSSSIILCLAAVHLGRILP